MNQKLIQLQGERKSVFVVEDFSILSIIHRTRRQKNQQKYGRHKWLYPPSWPNWYLYFITPTAAEYMFFFSKAHKISWGHITNLNTFRRIQVTQSMFSDYNGIKIEICKRKISEKFSNIWILVNTPLNCTWVKRNKNWN